MVEGQSVFLEVALGENVKESKNEAQWAVTVSVGEGADNKRGVGSK
jgi:hypothetical protein